MQDEGKNKTPAECTEGLDYRQLRAFVRSEEDGSSDSVPPWVREHIESCAACRPKWNSLRRNDPVVKKQFESRIGNLMEQVNIQEHIFGSAPGPKPSPVPLPVTAKKRDFIDQFRDSLANRPAAGALHSQLSQYENEPLDLRMIVDIVNHVRQIANAQEWRFERSCVVRFFEQRLKKTVSQEVMYDVLARLAASDNLEPLHDVTELEIAVAGFSETTESAGPPLLTMSGGHVFFNAPLLRRLRNAVHV